MHQLLVSIFFCFVLISWVVKICCCWRQVFARVICINVHMRDLTEGRCTHIRVRHRPIAIMNVNRQDKSDLSKKNIYQWACNVNVAQVMACHHCCIFMRHVLITSYYIPTDLYRYYIILSLNVFFLFFVRFHLSDFHYINNKSHLVLWKFHQL